MRAGIIGRRNVSRTRRSPTATARAALNSLVENPAPGNSSAPGPSLHCVHIGGPLDGQKTGDLPVVLSGKMLTGMVSKSPLAQPAHGSIFAVYDGTSETQVNGFWIFEHRRLEGPNGETLVAKKSTRLTLS